MRHAIQICGCQQNTPFLLKFFIFVVEVIILVGINSGKPNKYFCVYSALPIFALFALVTKWHFVYQPYGFVVKRALWCIIERCVSLWTAPP